MAAVTLPTHYRNVFAELGYAQAEIDARRYYDNCLYFFSLPIPHLAAVRRSDIVKRRIL